MNKVFSYDTHFPHGQMRTPAGDIFQIAELSLIRGSEMPAHRQSCDELTYVVSGKAKVWCGDTVREISPGQIHYIEKGQVHRIVVDPEQNLHYFCIGFTLDPAGTEVSSFAQLVRGKRDFLLEDEGGVQKLFSSLMTEVFFRDEESRNMIYFYFVQLLITLCRILRGNPVGTVGSVRSSTPGYAVYRAMKHIDTHYIKLTTVRQVAEALSYSEYYLSHIFREKLGVTIKDYLLQKKLATAAELLRSSNMSVTDIGEHLQFASIHAFSGAFKRYFNMSPSAFRRQERGNE